MEKKTRKYYRVKIHRIPPYSSINGTENVNGDLYSIETDEYNDIVNDYYGECKFIPANDAKVYFASYNGVPVNPYLYNDFVSLVECLRELDLSK